MTIETVAETAANASALEKGRAIAARLNPDLEDILSERYDAVLPGFSETLIESAYGRFYAREGLDLKTRQLATVAALTALGGQTAPQLKVNIEHALAAGAGEREILEVILQMAAYGGWPAAINGLNAALELFGERARSPEASAWNGQ
ncbi:carboxymuconolactone decarboxylase family protein [Nitratireductor aquimarinus]|uniref:Carboxymuconolactone decarboxylase family protein n=1 Tax=Nitratireductor aquimarinus TaxID=889300 RepID=A0ABU4ANV7_9HYPH|nr:carboxymuconolactone decarboxylase family protein [Nitratireductor aquimarinus]MDV6227922.1 carboxymuconolactone decarboxylase family protein [Nitratireductor aquimarinus]